MRLPAPALGLLLLFALGAATSAEASVVAQAPPPHAALNTSKPALRGRRGNLFKRLPSSIHGIDAEVLHRTNPADAAAAYKECMQHGTACKLPCTSISSCAACHPNDEGGATVCAFCMPGYARSADKSSCVPCKANTFSAGGRAASCTLCPEGETAGAAAAQCTPGRGTVGHTGGLHLPADTLQCLTVGQSPFLPVWCNVRHV